MYFENHFYELNLVLWCGIQVKTMRVLEYFPTIEDPNIRKSLFEVCIIWAPHGWFRNESVAVYVSCSLDTEFSGLYCFLLFVLFSLTKWYALCLQILQRILMGTDVVKNVNKNNASHAVLFEALALVRFFALYIGSMFFCNIASYCHWNHNRFCVKSLNLLWCSLVPYWYICDWNVNAWPCHICWNTYYVM